MTIDGKNIYTAYGCTLLEGSLDTLLKYPKRKAVKYNNWAESNGIDPDLSVVEFEPRTIKLSFLMESDGEEEFWRRYNKLATDLSAPGYREISVIEGMIHHVRLNAGASYSLPVPLNLGKNYSSFDLNFIEDTFTTVLAYPAGGISLQGQFAINGFDFGRFGIGCDDELDDILKTPSLKEPFSDGRNVDLSTIRLQHKTIKLSLWMLAGSVGEFLNNYHAFFSQLSGAGLQELYINVLGSTIQVYYTDCPSLAVEVWGESRIAVRFSLSLTAPVVTWVDAGGITRYRVLKDKEFGILADEEGRIITFN